VAGCAVFGAVEDFMVRPACFRLIKALIPVLSLCAGAKADIVFIDLQMDVFIGTATLSAPGGGVLSTKSAMTVDEFPSPDIATQMANDPLEPLYVRNHISDFIGNTDLGAVVNPLGISFADAEQNLLNQLTNQPQPFVVTGDTGLFAVSVPFSLVYITGPFPGGSGHSYEGNLNVSVFERDLQEAAVPEPRLWLPLACLLAVALAWRRR
jgi:hypothetical protein